MILNDGLNEQFKKYGFIHFHLEKKGFDFYEQ
jgi:alpha-beta hydrolase superfamily lysophospholipase